MKRLKKMSPGFLCLGLGCMLAMNSIETSLYAATLVEQDFDLANGSLVEGSGGEWQHRSGGEGDLLVKDGALQVSSSASEDVGIALGDSVFGESSNETLFVSFTLKVVDLPTSGGGYFAHFRGGSSATFRGRLFISASEDGGYQLAVGNGASKFADSAAFPTPLNLGEEYRIVMSYEPSTAITKLGIDPVLESDLALVATDSVSVKSISQFALRQASGIGTLQIDHLKISTEFSDLSANVEPQEPTLKIQSNQIVLPERGGPSFLVQIERKGPLDDGLSLDLDWHGTAEFGVDYLNAPEVITFLPDQTWVELNLMVVDDDLKEGSETIELTIHIPEGVKVSGANSVRLEILDDDLTTIELSISQVAVTEGEDEIFEIYLDRIGDISKPLNLNWSAGGNTEKGIDLDWSVPFSVSFSSGQERLIIEIEVLDDHVTERVEEFLFQLELSELYQTDNSEIRIQILSDDFEGMLFEDDFQYESGTLIEVSSGQWKHTSGAEREVNIFAGQLDLNEIESEDIRVDLPFPDQNAEVSLTDYEVFVGFDVFVAKPPQGDGTYWAHFRGSTSSTFKGRLFSKSVNPEEGTFELGISNGQAESDVWFPRVFETPVNLRLVLGYHPGSSRTRLWVNPDSESASHIVAADETSSPQMTGFAFRQPSSRSEGMGRLLIDHLKISTNWNDVVEGGGKPYLYWRFDPSAADVSEFIDDLDLDTITLATGLESLIPSQELGIHRLPSDEGELWVNFNVRGEIILDEDLSILQGQGPILIKPNESKGILHLAPITDALEEPAEMMTLSLLPHDSYQVAYPSEAVFVLQDATVIEPTPLIPLIISLLATEGEHGFSLELSGEGAQGQSYIIQSSVDLKNWQTWRTGQLQQDLEILSLEDFSDGHLSRFFQVISTQP